MMDIQTGLIYVGIVVIIAVVLFAISLFGTKEKTYDEAIAEQRNLPNEHLLLGRSGKDKNKDKKQKKVGKKVKEKPSESESTTHGKLSEPPASTHEKGHVEFVEPEAEVISEQHVQEEKKKKKKVKPILLNKNGHSVVVEAPPSSMLANHFEESLPKDDLLLKREASREDLHVKSSIEPVKTAVSTKGVVAPKGGAKIEKPPSKVDKNIAPKLEKSSVPKPEKVSSGKSEKTAPKVEKVSSTKTEKPVSAKEEKIVATKAEKVEKPNAPKLEKTPAPKPDKEVTVLDQDETIPIPASVISKEQRPKKKKSELATLQQMSGDREGVNVSLIVPLVQKAELSRSEIQILIDLLLNKQQGSAISNAEWIEGRQDPVVKLKRQLAEKEKALSEEQEASQAFQSKLKELRTQLNTERSRLTLTCRQLEEAATSKQAEVQHLTTRLQLAIETHGSEKQALTQQVQQLQAKLADDHLMLRKLTEEQGQTQGVLQQELMSQRQQLELHIAHLSEKHQEADATYKNQLNQLHGQLHEQETINATLSAEMQSLRENSMGRDGENQMLRDQMSHLENQIRHQENQSQELNRQMEDLRLMKSNLEHRVSNTMRCENALKYEYETLRNDFVALKEAHSKVADIQNETGRLRSENDKMAAAMKELQSESQLAKDEKDKLSSKLSETLKDSKQLREENESLAAQVTAVTERPAAEGRENGDVSEEPAPKEKNALELILNEKLAELEKLTAELNTLKTDNRKANEELEVQKEKNNALRIRNWNAMEALSSAEKSLDIQVKESQKLVTETSNAVRLEEQKAVRQVLQRILPDVKVDDSVVHSTWVERFESAAKTFLAGLKSNSVETIPDKPELQELQAQNTKLQSMVTHYKTIIQDTEKLLNELQANAEEEENRWRAQLKKREIEMESLCEEKKRLEQTLERMKGDEQAASEVCGVEFAFGCIEKSLPLIMSEMQAKLQELQEKLHSEEAEKSKWAKQYEIMCSQVAGKGDAPDMSAAIEKLNEEKLQLSYALQSAQEKEREMSKEIVKLKSQVQIGQDSLSQEQQVSKQLMSQVDKLNVVSQNHSVATNGAATESSISESLSVSSQPLPELEKKSKSKKKKGGSSGKK